MIPALLWTYRARGERVIDGDTVALVVDAGFGIFKGRTDNHFRIKGVNCPEVHGDTREAGLAAASYTAAWLTAACAAPGDWPLIIQTERLSSDQEARTFERWVADIWRVIDGANLADDLLAFGHAVAL